MLRCVPHRVQREAICSRNDSGVDEDRGATLTRRRLHFAAWIFEIFSEVFGPSGNDSLAPLRARLTTDPVADSKQLFPTSQRTTSSFTVASSGFIARLVHSFESFT